MIKFIHVDGVIVKTALFEKLQRYVGCLTAIGSKALKEINERGAFKSPYPPLTATMASVFSSRTTVPYFVVYVLIG